LRVVSRGVDPVTKEIKDLFEIEILNKLGHQINDEAKKENEFIQ